MAEKKPIGKITHFFPKIGVAVIKADKAIKEGDKISIIGHENKVDMVVESMQIDHVPVKACKKGQEAGLKVPQEVKEGDLVFKGE
jgi:hypothetical protein